MYLKWLDYNCSKLLAPRFEESKLVGSLLKESKVEDSETLLARFGQSDSNLEGSRLLLWVGLFGFELNVDPRYSKRFFTGT